jgi:N-acetyl-anhydromuramyl-L-alanine amidase AmpD
VVRKTSHRRVRGRTAAIVAGSTAAALAVAGGLFISSGAQADQTTSSAGTRQADFASAAKEFHVPLGVLLGVSYEESQWEAHKGQYNTDGGYGPMGLTDVTSKMVAGGSAGAAGRGDLDAMASDPARHTLDSAAKLTGAPTGELKDDDRQNIRAGAALLASYEKKVTGGSTPADPGAWYGAVAKYSQSTQSAPATAFADSVYKTIRGGATGTTADGQRVKLAADSGVTPETTQVSALKLKGSPAASDPQAECPASLNCQFLPANTANYQLANRPADGVGVQYIVIHDTETSYDAAIALFQSPTSGDAANYVIRSSDGAITQLVPNQDVAFHAGNFWFNMHSIGIEHEGFAAQGATWYTEAQYRTTAALVRSLAAKYGIPLDREHIIGHDNVPGPGDSFVQGMHWDPGPAWNWTKFMRMLNAPVDNGPHGVGPVGSAVTITPDFATNKPTVSICPSDDATGSTTACTDANQASDALQVHTSPSDDAPLVGDPYLHTDSVGTNEISDWGSTVSAGQQYVVADKSGDWTAIWYGGQNAWFRNPHGVNTTPAHHVKVISAGATAVPVFGSGYPQASEYPADLAPSAQTPLTKYPFTTGQAYVATSAAVPADDFFHNPPDTVVKGTEKYYTIQYNHRVVLVDEANVNAHPAR